MRMIARVVCFLTILTISGLTYGQVGEKLPYLAEISVTQDTDVLTVDLPSPPPKYIVLRGVVATTTGATDTLKIRFNSDSGPNYSWYYSAAQDITFPGEGGCVSSCNESKPGGNEFNQGFVALNVANSAVDFTYFMAEISNVGGAYKKVLSRDSAAGIDGNRVNLITSTWEDTSPITSISLFLHVGEIRAGSRFVVLGF